MKVYPCQRCGKPYRSLKGMKNHYRFACEHEKKFSCNFCTASYYYKHHLQRHKCKYAEHVMTRIWSDGIWAGKKNVLLPEYLFIWKNVPHLYFINICFRYQVYYLLYVYKYIKCICSFIVVENFTNSHLCSEKY